MSEMIYRVARAIHAKSDDHLQDFNCFKPYWMGQAVAAIEAMREPTEAMVIAGQMAIPATFHFERRGERVDRATGEIVVRDQPWIYAKPAFGAMIDEALK